MASETARAFHNQTSLINKQFVIDRIAYGTKSSSPMIRDDRRMNPMNYFNPLPDNSSGSKNRLFESMKDESGRPNAMEQVYMNQLQGASLRGGVLTDFKYAQMILKRRATDTNNIKLLAEQLPPVFPPLLELTDIDKQKLTLSQVISKVQDDLDTGDITTLTFDSMKTLARSLILLGPTFDESDITELSQIFDDMSETINSRVRNQGLKTQLETARSARGIQQYITNFLSPFVVVLAKAVNLPENAKRALITSSARTLFATVTSLEETPKNIIGFNNKIMKDIGFDIAEKFVPGINYLGSRSEIAKELPRLRGMDRAPQDVNINPNLIDIQGPTFQDINYHLSVKNAIETYVVFFKGTKGLTEFKAKLATAPSALRGIFTDFVEQDVSILLNNISTDKESERVFKAFNQKVKFNIPLIPALLTERIPRLPRRRPEVAPEVIPEEEVAEEVDIASEYQSPEDVSQLTVKELKQLLERYSLRKTGNKPELVQRLNEYYAGVEGPQEAPVEEVFEAEPVLPQAQAAVPVLRRRPQVAPDVYGEL